MRQNILIIEDDPDIAESVVYNLEREGFSTSVAESGEKGLRLALNEKNPPAAIILDIMLPGMTGLELCRRLRKEGLTSKTPILMLTAKASETDRVAGLDLGADDYIVKPFSVKELIARVKAILRRTAEAANKTFSSDGLEIDFTDMRVCCQGDEIKLTRKEFALLAYLVNSSGRVATREQLLDNIWGYSYFGDTRTLDVHIRRLRQKLGACGNRIETVVGVGYRFIGSK